MAEQLKKKVILHIGCEKTGTTSIQNTLFANKELLFKDGKILYPKSLGGKNHWKLAVYTCSGDKNLTRFLPKGQTLEEFREKLREDFLEEVGASAAEKIIISNEWLHPRVRDKREFEYLKNLLLEVADDIEILMYIRRQDKMAMSLYSTSLKAGSYKRFSFPQVKDINRLPYYYDFFSIYKNWKSVFGPGKVSVRVYDRTKLYENDVVKDFCRFLGINYESFSFEDEDNLPISNFGIKLMLLLNRFIKFSNGIITPNIARKLRHILAGSVRGKPVLSNEDEGIEFLHCFASSNESLVIEYERDTGTKLAFYL